MLLARQVHAGKVFVVVFVGNQQAFSEILVNAGTLGDGAVLHNTAIPKPFLNKKARKISETNFFWLKVIF